MNILSPKVNFLAGSLTSTYHIHKVTGCDVYTWKETSRYLDVNGVPHKTHYRMPKSKSVFVNDTCVDPGYWDEYRDQNMELWEFIKDNFEEIYFHNHQHPSRYMDYLRDMVNFINENKDKKITIVNYRACWTDYLKSNPIDGIEVINGPYCYDLNSIKFIDEDQVSNKMSRLITGRSLIIGRNKSKCKVTKYLDQIKRNFTVDVLNPSVTISNSKLLDIISAHNLIFTGFYYGGEGEPELDVPNNKLEWSYLDSVFAGSIPITSSLFSKELIRLELNNLTLPYNASDQLILRALNQLDDKLYSMGGMTLLSDNYLYGRIRLINEVSSGNEEWIKLLKG